MSNKAIKFSGKIWTFGHNIDTDVIIATQYLINDLEEMKTHTFEVANSDFAQKVQPGDVIIAGKNFGCGSSRQQAVDVLKALEVGAVLAESFARIFYRNAINLGLPLIEIQNPFQFDKTKNISIEISSDHIEIVNGLNHIILPPFPEFILELLTT